MAVIMGHVGLNALLNPPSEMKSLESRPDEKETERKTNTGTRHAY